MELCLFSQLLPPQEPLEVACDNTAALTLCVDRKETQRAKQMDVLHHFACDHVSSGALKFVYCPSQENVRIVSHRHYGVLRMSVIWLD